MLGRLIDMLYERNDMNYSRSRFSSPRRYLLKFYPATAGEPAIRLQFFGDELDAITRFDPLTGHAREALSVITFFPAKQFVTPGRQMNRALVSIRTSSTTGSRSWSGRQSCSRPSGRACWTDYDLEK